MIILLHTSKTMHSPQASEPLHTPLLLDKASDLIKYLQSLTKNQLSSIMHISPTLADKTHTTFADWSNDPARQSAAIDSFVGDIYSGLRASTLTKAQRDYADKHLRILSGLYGILHPYDGINSYRLEMGYKLPDSKYANLYNYWGKSIAQSLPSSGLVINLASVEYSQAALPFIDKERVVTPKFLTMNAKTKEATFVVVHAKIARGAYARWLITSKIRTINRLSEFTDLGYRFAPFLSTPEEPVFICNKFVGKGLSMRLQKQ